MPRSFGPKGFPESDDPGIQDMVRQARKWLIDPKSKQEFQKLQENLDQKLAKTAEASRVPADWMHVPMTPLINH